MARALGVIRLSEYAGFADETTSPARQEEVIRAKAAQRGSEIIGWARDLDVSASKVHPMKRPELGAWLDRPEEYDEVIFWRLDRLVRRMIPDLTDMIGWSLEHEIALVSATEQLDLSGPVGRLIAMAIGTVAELESANTSQRVTESRDYLRRNRRWGGGRPPYGYMVVPNPDGPGQVLAVNEETTEIAREAVRRVIAGESVNAVAIDLNKRGIPAPQAAGKWRDSSLRVILRNRALLGHMTRGQGKGKVAVVGDDGMPVQAAPPLIELGDWARLQDALDTASKTKRRTYTPSMLLNVARCGLCGAPLYRWSRDNGYKTYYYYRCKNSSNQAPYARSCRAKLISVPRLDAVADEAVTDTYGQFEIMETRVIRGDDHSRQLAAVGQQIADLTAERYVRGVRREDFDTLMSQLQDEHARLAALPSQPDTTETVRTGMTVQELWSGLDVQGKRQFLLAMGWEINAHRDEADELLVVIGGGEYFAGAAILTGLTLHDILGPGILEDRLGHGELTCRR